MLRANLLANFSGGMWNAALVLLTMPIHVSLLGVEAGVRWHSTDLLDDGTLDATIDWWRKRLERTQVTYV